MAHFPFEKFVFKMLAILFVPQCVNMQNRPCDDISMAWYKRDVTPVLTHWSCVSFALSHRSYLSISVVCRLLIDNNPNPLEPIATTMRDSRRVCVIMAQGVIKHLSWRLWVYDWEIKRGTDRQRRARELLLVCVTINCNVHSDVIG